MARKMPKIWLSEDYEICVIIMDYFGSLSSDEEIIRHLEQEKLTVSILKGIKPGSLGAEFYKIVFSEDNILSMILKAHLIIERFLNIIIANKFKNSSKLLEKTNFTFFLKLEVLNSKNYLDEVLYSDINQLNRIRNKFAHDLFYNTADFELNKFYCWGELYNKVKLNSIQVKRKFNIFILKNILDFLLSRLTKKYPFISEIKFDNEILD